MNPRLIGFYVSFWLPVSCLAAIVDDIGPNTPNGAVNIYGRSDTAGQPIGLGGDTSALYVVSGNAGVWKSVNGGPWVQLQNSPPRAYCIAVDPNNNSHLCVGERDGDAVLTTLNGSGVWESFDGGDTWPTYFNPLSVGGCGSQAIPAGAFSASGSLFVASPCGIGRKAVGDSTFDFSHTPAGLGPLTAIVASESKIWARTLSKLLVSSDDGLNWTTISIPTSIGGLTVTFPSRGDQFSLGAFDSGAFMVGIQDPTAPCGNMNRLVIYDAATDRWLLQPRLDDTGNPQIGCDGTGCGGRRYVKSFVLNRPDLPASVGQRFQLFVGVAQDVYQAKGLNSDGTISGWNHVLGSSPNCNGSGGQDPVHNDHWDFLLAQDASKAWVATDGGVFSKTWPSGSWGTQNQNLFTPYIYTLTTLQTPSTFSQRFGYAPPDNDGWFFDPGMGWNSEQFLGDVNWSAGDLANSNYVLLVRIPNCGSTCGFARLIGFNNSLPNGQTVESVTLNPNTPYDGVLSLQFIQTLQNESPNYPYGDVVMLANLPLQYQNSNGQLVNVPGPLGQPNPSGAPVLIRNTQFAQSPDANSSQFQTWTIEANDLPSGTQGFWVSGGHANPTFYAYTASGLYKRNSGGSGWSQLSVTGLLRGGTHGPAFVNPYNPRVIYALTTNGVMVSTEGGATFQVETTLTALLTASGKFPLTASFTGGNGRFLVFGSHGTAMGTLSDMAFDRSQPGRMVAGSPFTGVFYNSGNGTWTDLTGYLPKPLASVSTLGISGPAIYVGTQGRGLLRLFLDDSQYCFINGPVLSVPSPYSTVHAAYNAAGPGCTIIRVNGGVYHETPMPFTLNKHLRLEAQGGPVTITQ